MGEDRQMATGGIAKLMGGVPEAAQNAANAERVRARVFSRQAVAEHGASIFNDGQLLITATIKFNDGSYSKWLLFHAVPIDDSRSSDFTQFRSSSSFRRQRIPRLRAGGEVGVLVWLGPALHLRPFAAARQIGDALDFAALPANSH